MLSAVFAVLFGLSLLPGRKPLCLRFAERISDGIVPEGAEAYCRALTWVWFAVLAFGAAFGGLAACGCLASFGSWAHLAWLVSPALFVLTFAVERPIRNRRFRVVFHTSGSTGKSKTIVKTFESLAREVAFHRLHYRESSVPVDGQTAFLGTVEWNHMYGKLWMDMLPKAMGCVAEPEVIRSPEALVAKMRSAKRVFLVTTPSFLDRFTRYADQYDVPQNCVEIVTSGALLPEDVSIRTRQVFGLEPRQIFGSTETGGVASRRGYGAWEVFPSAKVRARPVADEARPRLAVRSPYSFRGGWYAMGDAVEIDASGRSFRLFGRADRLVKINEERVNLGEMEGKVRAAGFPDCACVKLAGEHGDCLGLVLVARSADELAAPPNALELRRLFYPLFPKGTVPRKFRFVAELPRNAQGKVVQCEVAKLF